MKTTTPIIRGKKWKTTVALSVMAGLTLIFTTGAGKPPKGSLDIPLRVTIHSFDLLASDGLGDYVNGEKGVTAVFTAEQGRFSFDTGTRRRANVWIPEWLDQGNYRIQFLISNAQQDPKVNTAPDPNWQDLDLDQLPLTDLPTSVPVGLHFMITTSPSDTGSWRIAFGDYPLATEHNAFPCAVAAPAVVTRVGINEWTLEADDTDNHCLSHGFIDDRDFGRIAFPFIMTLRRK